MSMTVCQQGVQSGFAPWLVEPRVIGFDFSLSSRRPLKLPLTNGSEPEQSLPAKKQEDNVNGNIQNLTTQNKKSKNEFNNELNTKNNTKNEGFGGWSFLQALSDTTQGEKKENEEVYVHPLVKRSASVLTEKSLEMCTESLGSETGSNMSDNGDDLFPSLGLETDKPPRLPCFEVRKRSNGVGSFPPPLTTIRGGSSGGVGGGVQVKSQREDGRLVIKAISVETPQSCFKAERRDGRLRLHFLPSSCCSSNSMNEEFLDDECNIDENYHDDDNDDDDVDDDDGGDYYYDYDVDVDVDQDNGEDVGDEVEVGELCRPRGCKEEVGSRNKEMLNWEPFWVATS